MGALLRILIVALVLLVAAMFLVPRGRDAVPATAAATVLPESLPLPEVALVDDMGEAFTTADLRGDYRLLFFGFTHCPDICPLTLQVLASVRADLEARAPGLAPQIVFVSVDPERDTPERIREYLASFDPALIGITGPDEALQPLVETLGVTVHKTEVDGEHYNVVHNGAIYVIGPDAAWIAVFTGSTHDAAVIASDYLKIRRAAPVAAP
jgi:protein SCO1/2